MLNQIVEFWIRYEHILSNSKQSNCKKVYGPEKGYYEKRYEIQGGGQEMAVIVG